MGLNQRAPEQLPARHIRRLIHIFSFLTIAGCATISIPVTPGASLPNRAPAESAVVLFVLGAFEATPQFGGLPRAWPTSWFGTQGVDILDERGELLGRLRRRSWLAVERPPGPQTFYAVSTDWIPGCLIGPCPDGDAQVGLLRANLAPGEIYAVWLGASNERVTIGAAFEAMSRCNHPDSDQGIDQVRSWPWEGTVVLSFDLIAASGAAWATVNTLFHDERTVAVPTAPRGMRHPSADEALAAARARVGRCWNEAISTIGPDDGVTERPRATPLRRRGGRR